VFNLGPSWGAEKGHHPKKEKGGNEDRPIAPAVEFEWIDLGQQDHGEQRDGNGRKRVETEINQMPTGQEGKREKKRKTKECRHQRNWHTVLQRFGRKRKKF